MNVFNTVSMHVWVFWDSVSRDSKYRDRLCTEHVSDFSWPAPPACLLNVMLNFHLHFQGQTHAHGHDHELYGLFP